MKRALVSWFHSPLRISNTPIPVGDLSARADDASSPSEFHPAYPVGVTDPVPKPSLLPSQAISVGIPDWDRQFALGYIPADFVGRSISVRSLCGIGRGRSVIVHQIDGKVGRIIVHQTLPVRIRRTVNNQWDAPGNQDPTRTNSMSIRSGASPPSLRPQIKGDARRRGNPVMEHRSAVAHCQFPRRTRCRGSERGCAGKTRHGCRRRVNLKTRAQRSCRCHLGTGRKNESDSTDYSPGQGTFSKRRTVQKTELRDRDC